MNIICQSAFLADGLKALGHDVFKIPTDCTTLPLENSIRDYGKTPDLVLLELWSHACLPPDIAQYQGNIIGYAIDSPLNEYWLESAGHLFPLLFVDQLSSVRKLRARGVNAVWLPLCAQENYFRDTTEKKYTISFVGNTATYRAKRKNLLTFLQKHTEISLFENISLQKMQDICAASHIVLNENLFSGLTLRVFQAFASGSLLLTEAGGQGVRHKFRHGEHMLAYTPDDILIQIEQSLNDTAKSASIAKAGQQLCQRRHLAQIRAEEMLTMFAAETKKAQNTNETEKTFFEAKTRYYLARRNGGHIGHWRGKLKNIANQDGALAAEACLLLGDMTMRHKDMQTAREYYCAALDKKPNATIWGRLALLHASEDDIPKARNALGNALTTLSTDLPGKDLASLQRMKKLACEIPTLNSPAQIALALALFAKAQGQICHMGFVHQEEENLPEVALDLALFAHNLEPSQGALALALECSTEFGMAGEMLPFLLDAIRQGLLDDIMIAKTAEAAKSYYDFDLARELTCALGKRLR